MPTSTGENSDSTVSEGHPSDAAATEPTTTRAPRKGSAFWLSFLALIVCTFVSALDISGLATALPTITEELNGGDKFIWVGASYSLSSSAILPFSGRLADAFGRRPVMLASVVVFIAGSALSGAAQNMNMLIAARTLQGVGGGAILNLSEIIISDLVPLSERGVFMGIFSATWALASGVGPPIGGALAQAGEWRWIFYMNIPITGVAFVLVLLFLRVRTPHGSVEEKLSQLDVIGNLLIIAGATLALIGITWGGASFSWSSAHVLSTLIIGLVLIGVFFTYEWTVAKHPSLPREVVGNRTTVSGYLATLIHGVTSSAMFYYIPVYLQACLGSSVLRSSAQVLPSVLLVSPFASSTGALVHYFQKYRWANVLAWFLSLVGFGLLSTLRADSSMGEWVGYQIITAAGVGILFPSPVFPILAPLSSSRNAAALAVFSFSRTFAMAWGIAIGGTILQNRLQKTLPGTFSAMFPDGTQFAYSAIPAIGTLQEPLRTEVREAFASSLTIVWQTMIGLSGLGLLTVALMREIPMEKTTDDTYGLEEEKEKPENTGGRASEGGAKEDAPQEVA